MEVEVTDDSAEEPGNEPYPINIEMNGMDPGLMESDVGVVLDELEEAGKEIVEGVDGEDDEALDDENDGLGDELAGLVPAEAEAEDDHEVLFLVALERKDPLLAFLLNPPTIDLHKIARDVTVVKGEALTVTSVIAQSSGRDAKYMNP